MVGKKELKIAKSLFRKSLTNGSVEAVKVRTILNAIAKQRPAHMIGILRNYKRLIEASLSGEEVIVETPAKISNISTFEREIKEKTSAKRIIYKVNPNIIVGAKITHGDWVFDSTLDNKLGQLTNS